MPRPADCSHHAVRADRNDAVAVAVGNGLPAQLVACVGQHRLDDIADKRAVLRSRGLESRRFVAAPDDDVGRLLDVLDLVAVDHFLVAREVQHLRAGGAQRLADGEQHRVAEAAAHEHDGLVAYNFRGCPGGAHQDHRFAGLEVGAQVSRPAHLEHDGGEQALVLVDPRAGHRQAFHGQRRAAGPRGEGFEILQPVELPGLEAARGERRVQDHFDDGWREPLHFVDNWPQVGIDPAEERLRVERRGWGALRQHAAHHRVTLLRTAHGLDDVAEEGRVQVAEEADEASVAVTVQQHVRALGLGDRAFGLHRSAGFVARLEILAVQLEMRGIFSGEYGVRLRARRDQQGAGGKFDCAGLGPLAVCPHFLDGEMHRPCVAVFVHVDPGGRQAFREGDAFLQRLFHFFMVERVRGAVHEPAAVGERDAAPRLEQRDVPGLRGLPQCAGMRDELVSDGLLFAVPRGTHHCVAAFGDQRFVAGEEFLHLHHVIGQRLGGGVDRRQPAADHDDRQPDLQVGDGIRLGRAGELQRHQEVGGCAHAAREAVRDFEERRAARTGGQRHMVEAHCESVFRRDRAAEAHAAEHRELRAAFKQQAHHLEEVLVPAHGDAVLGHAAEACHDTLVQRLVDLADFADRLEGHAFAGRVHAREAGGQRLDLEPVDAHHRMAVVHQVVRETEAGRPQADHQHALAARHLGVGAGEVQRVPARQQRIDLEAPRQLEHVLQRARLGLRDVDRRLLLVDAGLHAVIADPVACGCHHRVVHADHGERTERLAAGLHEVELGDLFFQRASGEGHAELGFLIPAGRRLLAQALGAGVLALLVAPDAVVGLVQRAGEVGALVGQREAFAHAEVFIRKRVFRKTPRFGSVQRHEAHEVELLGHLEEYACAVFLLAGRDGGGPGCIACSGFERLRVSRLFLLPFGHVLGKGQLGERLAKEGFERFLRGVTIDCGGVLGLHLVHSAALHEKALDRVKGGQLVVLPGQRLEFGFDAEQPCEEILEVRRKRDKQLRLSLGCERGWVPASVDEPVGQRGVQLAHEFDELRVEANERVAVIEVGEREAETERRAGWGG